MKRKHLIYSLIVFVVIMFMPWLFTSFSIVDFNGTGGIGDTIGGITSPFINILAAFLLYLTLNNQIDSQKNVISNWEADREITIYQNDLKKLDVHITSVKSEINRFDFTYSIDGEVRTVIGTQAINDFFIRLNYLNIDPHDGVEQFKLVEYRNLLKIITLTNALIINYKNLELKTADKIYYSTMLSSLVLIDVYNGCEQYLLTFNKDFKKCKVCGLPHALMPFELYKSSQEMFTMYRLLEKDLKKT